MPGPQSSPVHVGSSYCYLILTPTPIKEVIFLSLVWRGGNGFCRIRSLNHSDLGSERQGKILTPNPEGSKTQSLCRTGPYSTGTHLTSTPPRCEGNRQESGSVAELPLRWNYTHKHGGMHTHTHTRTDIEHTQAYTQKHVCTRTHTLAHTHIHVHRTRHDFRSREIRRIQFPWFHTKRCFQPPGGHKHRCLQRPSRCPHRFRRSQGRKARGGEAVA